VHVADPGRGEGQLLRVAHPAVPPRDEVGVSTTPTYIMIARTPSPAAPLFSIVESEPFEFQDGH
jgi:hypothetical protein